MFSLSQLLPKPRMSKPAFSQNGKYIDKTHRKKSRTKRFSGSKIKQILPKCMVLHVYLAIFFCNFMFYFFLKYPTWKIWKNNAFYSEAINRFRFFLICNIYATRSAKHKAWLDLWEKNLNHKIWRYTGTIRVVLEEQRIMAKNTFQ